jgi:hypothetical protein
VDAEVVGNFMLGVDLRSFRNPDITVIRASQPVSLLRRNYVQELTIVTPSSCITIIPNLPTFNPNIPPTSLRPTLASPLTLPIEIIGL